MQMNFITVLGIVSSIATIVGLFLPSVSKRERLLHGGYGLAIAVLSCVSVYYWQQQQRALDVQRAADTLVSGRGSVYSELGFIQASLAFLEKNRDMYPDTYARAQQMCERDRCLPSDELKTTYMQNDLSSAFAGILSGIGTLEDARPDRVVK